jgi:Polyketide cyclase / dehydrase and lipid transport
MSAFVTAPLVHRKWGCGAKVLPIPRAARVLTAGPAAVTRIKSTYMRAEPGGGTRAGGLTSLLGTGSTGNNRRVDILRPAPNRRIVKSDLVVYAPIHVVWEVLSDYEKLDEYIPNLAISRRLPHPRPAGIRLEQCGVQSILGFEFRASVVMDMAEVNRESLHSRCINFDLVESRDFREFSGHWRMEALPDSQTALYYSVSIAPKGLVPVAAIEWRISEDVPQNMDAVKRQCERRRRAASAAARRATGGASAIEPDTC